MAKTKSKNRTPAPTFARTCDYCGSVYEATRKTSRFCGDNCRVAYNRLPEKLASLRVKSLGYWQDMSELVDRYPYLSTSFVEQIQAFGKELLDLRKEVLSKHPVQKRFKEID